MNESLSNAAQAFTVNLVRFKNFRDRMKRAHNRETGTLQRTVESLREQAEAYFDSLRRTPASVADVFAAPSAETLAENALS